MTSSSRVREEAIAFLCGEEPLVGIFAQPAIDMPPEPISVLIVVGGPQYRIGSHRQFVQLARTLAEAGYPSLRFDYRGMGDAGGDVRTFEHVGDDVLAALDQLRQRWPQATRHAVWGLCDGASAAMMFATADPAVVGIAAANPWVRSDATLAAATVKHYYGNRLMEREFWMKLLSGRFDWRRSLGSVADNLSRMWRPRRNDAGADSPVTFQERMLAGMASFQGEMLLMLSGNDLTAKEFQQACSSDPRWGRLLACPRVERIEFPEADHTFSQRRSSESAARATVEWLHRLRGKVDSRRAATTAAIKKNSEEA